MIKKLTVITVAFLLSFQAYSQTVLLSEEFDGNLSNWTAEGISCTGATKDNALWTWLENGLIVEGPYSDGFFINSPTANNGAAIFNSDYLDNGGVEGAFGSGDCPSPQRAALVSPKIDCSGQSEVFVYFYQFHAKFADFQGELGTSTFLDVSSDGGATWDAIELNTFVAQNSWIYDESESQSVNISEYAARKSDVRIRFRFAGDYYFWMIDDVNVIGGRAANDISLYDYYYPLSGYEIPSSQIDLEPLNFLCKVANLGNSASNVTVKVKITQFDSDFKPVRDVYADSTTISALGKDESREVLFEKTYLPELDLGNYAIIFSAYQGNSNSETLNAADNTIRRSFAITQDVVNKYRKINTTFFNSTGGSYVMANIHEINPNYLEPLMIMKVNGSGFLPGSYSGNVNAYVIEATDAVNDQFSNITFDVKYQEPDGSGEASNLIGRGIGVQQVTNSGSRYALADFDVDMREISDPDISGVQVSAGKRYMIGLEYESNQLAQEFSDYLNYGYNISFDDDSGFTLTDYPFASFDEVTWIWNNGNWSPIFLSGVGQIPTYTANIGFTLSISTDVDEIPLPETAVSISPNPASEFINVQLDLTKPQKINVFLTDITGKIIKESVQDKFDSGTITFNTKDLVAGGYIVRVVTEEGSKTTKIVVL